MDNDTLQNVLEKLIVNQATPAEIELLRQAYLNGQISFGGQVSIGGNVQNSVIIVGNGNTVELSAEALELLTAAREAVTPISTIPSLPQPYCPYEYSLLQPSGLVGRNKELEKLHLWIDKSDQSPVQVVSAIGGMGKSALSWKWFNDIVNGLSTVFKGYLWWSFYEPDASFDNFLISALSYVTQTPKKKLENLKRYEIQQELLNLLASERFLVVLDGFERQLNAYHDLTRYVREVEIDEFDKILTRRDEHFLRKASDLKVGEFIKKLSRSGCSKILITSRLFPADLETPTGQHLPGCNELKLQGLTDEDALALWRSIRLQGNPITMSGSDTKVLGILNAFDNYPLLIRILAGQIAGFRRAPGNFEMWLAANPDFSVAGLPLIQVQSHVLTYALKNLGKSQKTLLYTLAALFIPVSFDTLLALLVGVNKSFASESEIDEALTELEDRGLVGWDRQTKQYSLHPVVRGVVWDALNENTQKDIQQIIANHFLAMPIPRDARTLEQLTPAVQAYLSLIEQERFTEAFYIFFNVLNGSSLFFQSTTHRANLLKKLFGNGLPYAPSINRVDMQESVLNAMGQAYSYSGQPALGVDMYYRALRVQENNNKAGFWNNLTEALCPMGKLYEAFVASYQALNENRKHRDDSLNQAYSLSMLGLSLATCELPDEKGRRGKIVNKISSRKVLVYAIQVLLQLENSSTVERITYAYLAQRAVWLQDKNHAEAIADIAWRLANINKFDRDLTRTSKLQGLVALMLDKIDVAEERLQYALQLSREINCVEDELPSLVGLAEIARRRKQIDLVDAILDDVFGRALEGSYNLALADAYIVLAQCKQDQGDTNAAVEMAVKAYENAWCDGISHNNQHHFVYVRGLDDAKKILDRHKVAYPKLPEFSAEGKDILPQIDFSNINHQRLAKFDLIKAGNTFIKRSKRMI